MFSSEEKEYDGFCSLLVSYCVSHHLAVTNPLTHSRESVHTYSQSTLCIYTVQSRERGEIVLCRYDIIIVSKYYRQKKRVLRTHTHTREQSVQYIISIYVNNTCGVPSTSHISYSIYGSSSGTRRRPNVLFEICFYLQPNNNN